METEATVNVGVETASPDAGAAEDRAIDAFLGEAPAIIWTTIVHPKTRISLNVTCRATTIVDAHASIGAYLRERLADGWIAAPTRDGQESLQRYFAGARDKNARESAPQPTAPAGPPPVPQQRPTAPQAAAPAPTPRAAAPASGDYVVLEQGTDPLNRVSVDADGRVLFSVGRFKYTFKDSRGREAVANLFDPDLGWLPEHFVKGADYQSEVTGLQVDWEKVQKGGPEGPKYYNVVSIHK